MSLCISLVMHFAKSFFICWCICLCLVSYHHAIEHFLGIGLKTKQHQKITQLTAFIYFSWKVKFLFLFPKAALMR